MPDSIADVVVKVGADIEDVEGQLAGIRREAAATRDTLAGTGGQLSLFNAAANDLINTNYAGQMNLWGESMVPLAGLTEEAAEATRTFSSAALDLMEQQELLVPEWAVLLPE